MNLMDLVVGVILMLIPVGILAAKKHFVWAGVCAALCIFTGLVDGADAIGGMAMLLIPIALIVLLVSYINSKKAKKAQERNATVTNAVQQQNIKVTKIDEKLAPNTEDSSKVENTQPKIQQKQEASKGGKIETETSIKAVLNTYPETDAIFKKYNMGCSTCAAAAFESIKDGCLVHGVDVEQFLNELNAVLEDKQEKARQVEQKTEATTMENNDDTAQKNYDLGMKYVNGSDPQKGLQYLELAANMNHIESQYWLGYLLSDGNVVKQDSVKGARYLKMASDNGYTKAHFEYAISLFTGCGVERDDELAMVYLKKSADEGYTTAQDRMLALSLGLIPSPDVDPDEAELWYKKLCSSINIDANTRALFEQRIKFVRSIKKENNGEPIQTISDGNRGVLYLVGGESGKVYKP